VCLPELDGPASVRGGAGCLHAGPDARWSGGRPALTTILAREAGQAGRLPTDRTSPAGHTDVTSDRERGQGVGVPGCVVPGWVVPGGVVPGIPGWVIPGWVIPDGVGLGGVGLGGVGLGGVGLGGG
jgi:hypothetical protein